MEVGTGKVRGRHFDNVIFHRLIDCDSPPRGAPSKESPKDNFNKGFKGNYLFFNIFYAPGPPLHWFPRVGHEVQESNITYPILSPRGS